MKCRSYSPSISSFRSPKFILNRKGTWTYLRTSGCNCKRISFVQVAFLTFLPKVAAIATLPIPTGAAIYFLVFFLGHLCEATTFAAYEVQDRRLTFACDRDLCDTCAGPKTNGSCYNTGAPAPGPKCSPETLCATPIAGGCRQDVMCRPGTYRVADAGRINFLDVISLDGFEIRAWSDIDSSTTPFSCS